MISIWILKLCHASPLNYLNYLNYLNHVLKMKNFLLNGKKQMQFLQIKKETRKILENYRPISLLPIDEKIFERTLYDNMFEFFAKNDSLSHKQSGFKRCNSCINQLLWITHGIYKSFGDSLDVRGVFLDISKSFDKVWHKVSYRN